MDNYPVYKFNLEITGDIASSDGALPIYDDCGLVIGGFTVQTGDMIVGFVAGHGHPMAIEIATEAPVWFHPRQGPNGLIAYAIVTFKPMGLPNYRINPVQEKAP